MYGHTNVEISKEDVRYWLPILVLAGGLIATAAVANHQISQNADAIDAQVSDHDLLIRVETRQETIQQDIEEIKGNLQKIIDCCMEKE